MSFEQPGWTRQMATGTVLDWATLGPIGRRLPAPGTWGSAAGLVYFVACFHWMGIVGNLLASAVGIYLAVGICGEAEIRLGRHDPGEVILDEFVAMPLCFLGWEWIAGPFPAWAVLLAGFALFRFFDIRKPWVIDSLQSLPGGWGIVLDDVAAALATCATLHIAHAVWAIV
ncbi:MAG TPA: phosphatidylglycerophosphatase A [Opitutaceae bacterium]|nr:phosphatidylglycerophosphatase A [Opitutaceae bacterium]